MAEKMIFFKICGPPLALPGRKLLGIPEFRANLPFHKCGGCPVRQKRCRDNDWTSQGTTPDLIYADDPFLQLFHNENTPVLLLKNPSLANAVAVVKIRARSCGMTAASSPIFIFFLAIIV